jgi:hypothetical protein
VNCNTAQGAANYTVTGASGKFTLTAGSGALAFTDADTNDTWAITPQQVIPPGGTVNLFFSAKFDNGELLRADGQSLRTEVIVTFGNAGARGGSGASASNIDIDGNGIVNTTDEANVRSVPARVTKSLPPPLVCNDEVTLADALAASGTAGYDTVGGATFPLTTSTGGAWQVIATVTGGDVGGTVTNTVTLAGESTDIVLTYNTGAIDPVTGLPITAEKIFTCCEGADLTAESSVRVASDTGSSPVPAFVDGDYCTHTVQQWPIESSGQPPHTFTLRDFDSGAYTTAFFPSGLQIGYVGGGTLYDVLWHATALGYARLSQAIDGATGAAAPLTAAAIDPASMSGGSFTGEVAALALNVGFSGSTTTSGTPASFPAGFGALTYHDPGQPLDGLTIAQILAAANEVAGRNKAPTDYSFASGTAGYTAFGVVLQKINGAFSKASEGNDHNVCKVKQFAQDHLLKNP